MSRRRRIQSGPEKPWGQSKHRKARVLKFSGKHPDSGKAFGGSNKQLRDLVAKERREAGK